MKLDVLREFLLLSTTLNFTETAKSLYISQSVLSNHISALEKELGTQLFIRDQHSVRLTEVGKIFVEDAKEMVANYNRALNHISEYQNGVSKLLRVGFLLGAFGAFLPQVCKEFKEQHPEVDFRFQSMEMNALYEALNNNEIDLGFTMIMPETNISKYQCERLYKDRLVLAMSKEHHLAQRKMLTLDELKGETVLLSGSDYSTGMFHATAAHLAQIGATIRTTEQGFDIGAIPAFLMTSNTVTFTLAHLAFFNGAGLSFVDLEGDDFDVEAAILWKRAKETDTILSFISCLREYTAGYSKDDFLSKEALGL